MDVIKVDAELRQAGAYSRYQGNHHNFINTSQYHWTYNNYNNMKTIQHDKS